MYAIDDNMAKWDPKERDLPFSIYGGSRREGDNLDLKDSSPLFLKDEDPFAQYRMGEGKPKNSDSKSIDRRDATPMDRPGREQTDVDAAGLSPPKTADSFLPPLELEDSKLEDSKQSIEEQYYSAHFNF